MAFHFRIEPIESRRGGIARGVRSGRFRRSHLLVPESSLPYRGMLYSLLIHALAVFTLAGLPVAVLPTHVLEADLLMLDAPYATRPASNISGPEVVRELESTLTQGTHPKSTGEPKRVPAIVVSNPPNPTNRFQTILRPDFADHPPRKQFVLLPNLLTLTPRLSRAPKRAAAFPPKSLTRDLDAPPTASVLVTPTEPMLAAPRADLQASAMPSLVSATAPLPEDAREASGRDRHDVLSLSIFPTPASEALRLPIAESRGRFVILTPPNSTAPDREPGGAAALNTSSERRAVHRGKVEPRKPDAASLATSTVSGVAPNVFAGITIQGGDWNRDWTLGDTPLPDAHTDASPNSLYPLTITSSGNSGGGLRDFGVFKNQPVYTDYFSVDGLRAPYAPPLVLQFALVDASGDGSGALTHPRPETELLPRWPEEAALRHAGEMIVVFAMIGADGRGRDVLVMESPSADLSSALLDALAQWTFRPAAVNGQPAAVKALFGVPIVPRQ